MQLTKELFVIPNGEKFILYAPLKRAVAEVNADMVQLLKRLNAGENLGDLEEKFEQLRQVGIITDKETPKETYVPTKDYTPTTVTLIPGFDCNLRCLYCYSNGGENTEKTMKLDIAKAAIDFIIKNALAKGEKQVELGFHGGGEPFLHKNMSLIKGATDYFRNRAKYYKLQPAISAVTNGVMNQETIDWVINNLDEISISFDGPKDIQNKQRPTAAMGDSFSPVMQTIKYLESKKFRYNLRTVITKESASRMPEIVKFLSSVSSVDHFSFEPLFECGRCQTSKVEAPNPEKYVEYLIKSKEVASKLGKTVLYACSEVEGVYDYFCGAVGTGFFFVLPDGNVTSCLEVCRKSDPRADIFMIGKYNFKTKKFVFNKNKMKALKLRSIDNVPGCRDCFAKYNCAGDCPARCYLESGNIFDVSKNSDRCKINQEATKNNLLRKLKGGNINGCKI